MYILLPVAWRRSGIGASYAAGLFLVIDDCCRCRSCSGRVWNKAKFRSYCSVSNTFSLYDKKTSDSLMRLARKLGQEPQCAIWGNYGLDASRRKTEDNLRDRRSYVFLSENTHGYEVMHKESISHCANLLVAYLRGSW